MSIWTSEEIRNILQENCSNEPNNKLGQVVFALFLEPHTNEKTNSTIDKFVNWVVNNLQKPPVMVHVEMVVLPTETNMDTDSPIHFATYYKDISSWRTNRSTNAEYYLVETANKWRAVPVFGDDISILAREECNRNCDAEYSILQYVTSAYGIRNLTWLLPKPTPKWPGHCATVTARVLKSACSESLDRPSLWYGPASLYKELNIKLHKQALISKDTQHRQKKNLNPLLHGSNNEVLGMHENEVMEAIYTLTMNTRSKEAIQDPKIAIQTQKDLANALFRCRLPEL
jgi:hypothetical protein